MKKILTIALFGMATASVSTAWSAVTAEQEAVVRNALQNARPGIQVSGVQESPIAGLYEVQVGNDSILMSADGKYFVDGKMYRIEGKKFISVADERLQPVRATKLAAVKAADMVVFSPQGKPKASVYVFTDVDCGFCRKLHKEVPELNAMGIEVRYLAFPRAGVPSPSADKLSTAWCAPDRKDMLTRLKNGEDLSSKPCDKSPVGMQYALGLELGITGTPAIFKVDGTLLPGYMPAAALAAELGLKPPVALQPAAPQQ